jgi:hypothetical protein
MYLEQLIEKIESSADWRAEKANQYPDDTRNQRSSRALRTLGERLKALSDDDENVVAYVTIASRLAESGDADEMLSSIEHESHYIGRYGFDYPQDGDPASFLLALTEHSQESVDNAEERATEKKREEAYEAAKETADEATKKAAHRAAKEAAEEAAKRAAKEAYKKTFDETYKSVYEEAYCETLIEALKDAP